MTLNTQSLTSTDTDRPRSRGSRWLLPILAVVSSFVLSGLFILLAGASPIEGYRQLLVAGFSCRSSDQCALLTTLQFMTPLLLTGLSAAVAFRAGMFSIGQAGQMILGAAAATSLARLADPVVPAQLVLLLTVGFIAGGVWGWIPGVLKVYFRVNEVISTLLFNQLALLVIGFVRMGRVSPDLRLPILAHGTKLNGGLLIALIVAGLVYGYLWWRREGYEARMSGDAFPFAWFGGIRGRRAVLVAMSISGGLAGLAGAIEVTGVHYRFVSVFSGGGGFDGIAVAILGQVHPLGVAIAAFLLAGLRLGATNGLQLKAGIPRELGGAMIAMMILLVSIEGLYGPLALRVQGCYRKISTWVHGQEPPPQGSD